MFLCLFLLEKAAPLEDIESYKKVFDVCAHINEYLIDLPLPGIAGLTFLAHIKA